MLSEQVLLGNTTIKVSTSIQYRRRRYRLLDEIKAIMRKHGMPLRVLHCMHCMHSNTVDVMRRQDSRAYVKGVSVCGSVWMCPVCGSRIMMRRREELHQALKNNPHLLPVMLTVTLQHSRKDKLFALLDALDDALRKLKAGRWWQNFSRRYGLVAHVSSLEIRYSQASGWHPHKHILLFLDLHPDELNIQVMKEELTERYIALLADHGRYASEFHSIDVSIGDQAVGSYIAKWDLCDELVKANYKEKALEHDSFSPFQLADLAGLEWCEKAFIEYAQVTYGKKAITWSHGARRVLGLGGDTGDAVLAQEIELPADELIISLDREQWKKVLRHGAIANILEVAERAGAVGVIDFLSGLDPPA